MTINSTPGNNQITLVLAHTAVLGGASRSLALVIGHLREMGCEINLFAPPGPACQNWEAYTSRMISWAPPVCNWLGAPLYSTYAFESSWDRSLYNFVDLLLLPARLLAARKALRAELTARHVDSVYVNSLALFPLVGLLANLRREFGFHLVWQIREVLNEKLVGRVYRGIARAIARTADRVVGISSMEVKPFQPYCPVDVLHNSVSPDWVRPASPPEAASTPLRVAMAGAYRPSKGVAEFIQMAEIVAQNVQGVEFFLFSPHPIPPRYRRLFEQAGRFLSVFSEKLAISLDLVKNLSSAVLKQTVNVTFDHPLRLDDYCQTAVYVRSDNSGSPWGRDIIEAMWAGVPVVATGTSQEFVIDGETGYLVPPGNVNLLAEQVTKLLADPALRNRMSEAAYKRAGALFDPAIYKEHLREIFQLHAGEG
jgi:glycosyltransferase involved in cell wall biosynthesis